MFKKFYFILLFSFIVPSAAYASSATEIDTFGKWTAYSFVENGEKVCYMTSIPVTDAGDYSSRGDIAAFITHWPTKESKDVFSYVAGYPYKNGSDVNVAIGNKNFSLFTQGEMAWAPDSSTDQRLISAIKQGTKMVIKGTSSRGTLTTDTYSLEGSTAAYNVITKECK